MARAAAGTPLRLRLVVLGPPKGVAFAVQRGKKDRFARTIAEGGDVTFEIEVSRLPTGDFRGAFVQGRKGERWQSVSTQS